MKRLIIILIFVVHVFSFADKIGTISDVFKPQNMTVRNDRAYILQGAEIFVFSVKDATLINKFGRSGEGPGEIQVMPFLNCTIQSFPDFIYIQTMNKALFFNLKGKFIKELKKSPQFFNILPLGKNYIVNNMKQQPNSQTAKSALCIYDDKLKIIKEICYQSFPFRGANLAMASDTLQFNVYKNHAYIDRSKLGFVVEIYDPSGKLIKSISKDIPSLKITEKDKKSLIKELKEDSMVKPQITRAGGWEKFSKRLNIHWPEKFPHIRDLLLASDKIYLQTFKIKNGKSEFVIMDLDGKNMKNVFLPKVKEPSVLGRLMGRGTRFFDIKNNHIYYLVEDEDSEVWELHSLKI